MFARSLRMEPLENRHLLTAVTVTTALDVVNADDGVTSLREAIAYANSYAGDDTIIFDSSLASQAITLTEGELDITDTKGVTTITGLGADLLTISGNNTSHVFHVCDRTTAVISGLTISNGNDTFGGGIFNTGTLTMTNCTVSGNMAAKGGGICNAGTLTLTKCTVSKNTAGLGGGVDSDGAIMIITDSRITENTANGCGGGIYSSSGSLTITGSTVSKNSTSEQYSSGGGVYNCSVFTAINSVFTENTASELGGNVANCSGVLTVSNCIIKAGSAYDGGGIYNDGTVTISNSDLSENPANCTGGALFNRGNCTLTNTNVSNNSARRGGGGIANIGDTLTIANSVISNNSANYGGGVSTGSGIHGSISKASAVTISYSTISGNAATDYGGGINNNGILTVTSTTIADNSAQMGGGIYAGCVSLASITSSTIARNEATSIGGGIYICPESYIGHTFCSPETTLSNTIVAANGGNTASPDIYNAQTTSITANYCLIEDTTGTTFNSDSANNITSVDPLLGTLGNFGGVTQTVPLLASSPALNTGSNALAADVAYDQRGYTRIIDDIIDIGAYEHAATDNVAPNVTLNVPTLNNTNTLSITVTATDIGDGIPNGTPVYLDVDTNHDGDFVDSEDRIDYAQAVLRNGQCAFLVSQPLDDGTYGLQVRVSDRAGNEGSGEATATIDTIAPMSSITPLSAITKNTTAFAVNWSGTDAGGSGIVSYDIYVSMDGGALTIWQNNTTDASAIYYGGYGHTYAFYIVAIDNAGNSESIRSIAQASTTLVYNSMPFMSRPGLNNIAPTTNDIIKAYTNAVDPDGDTVTFTYQWTVNGIVVQDSSNDTLNLGIAGFGDKGDVIAVTVTPNDGSVDGEAITSKEATVANTAPIVTVHLDDDSPQANDVITAVATTSDIDGDAVTLRYQWTVNGVIVQDSANNTLDLSVVGFGDKGDVIAVAVTPNDGTIDGTTVTSENATVANTAPVVAVHLDNDSPNTNDAIKAITTATDIDGDAVTLRYQWTVNGIVVQDSTDNTLNLSKTGFGDKGDHIAVTVTPNDGNIDGTTVTSNQATVFIPTNTIGLYNPIAGAAYLRNTNDAGVANTTVACSPSGNDWIALTGDWNGDDINEIGRYDAKTSTFYLSNANTSGTADVSFRLRSGREELDSHRRRLGRRRHRRNRPIQRLELHLLPTQYQHRRCPQTPRSATAQPERTGRLSVGDWGTMTTRTRSASTNASSSTFYLRNEKLRRHRRHDLPLRSGRQKLDGHRRRTGDADGTDEIGPVQRRHLELLPAQHQHRRASPMPHSTTVRRARTGRRWWEPGKPRPTLIAAGGEATNAHRFGRR